MAKRAAIAGVAVALLAVAIILWAATPTGAPSHTRAPAQSVTPPAVPPSDGGSREDEATALFVHASFDAGNRKWAEAKERLETLTGSYANTRLFADNRGGIARLLREAEEVLAPPPPEPPPPGGDFVLLFNGQSDYVSIPDSPALRLQTFTLEAWVWRRRGGPDLQHVFAKDLGQGNVESFGIFLRNKRLWHYTIGYGARCELRSGQARSISRTWTHCALVFDRGDCALFVNGRQAVRNRINPQPLYDGRPFHIGADLEGGRFNFFWNGAIDEVRLSSVARYRRNFTPARRFAPDAQTVVLLHFDEGQGDTAHDASHPAHPGRIHGARFIRRDKLGAAAR